MCGVEGEKGEGWGRVIDVWGGRSGGGGKGDRDGCGCGCGGWSVIGKGDRCGCVGVGWKIRWGREGG